MPTLHHILSVAHSGMTTSQATVASASRNIANANTPGYAHEVLPLFAQLGGLGVTAGSPVAIRNAILERGLSATAGRLGFFSAQTSYLERTEQLFNNLDGTGLSDAMQRFESALSAMTANPNSLNDRTLVLESARSLGTSFAATRAQLDRTSAGAREQAEAVARQVTGLAAEVAQLNHRIRSAQPGEEMNSLITRRATLIQEISGRVGVEVIPRGDGTVSLITAGGRPLVESTFPATVTVQQAPPPSGELSIRFERETGSDLLPLGAIGGELGGLIEVHNETVVPAQQRLDEIAYHFMDAFNQAHRAGFNLNGGTGFDFFDLPPQVSGAASQMTLSQDVLGRPENIGAASTAAGVPGDNGNALVLFGLFSQPGVLPDGSSFNQAWLDLGAASTNALLRAESGVALEQGSFEQLNNMLAAESGVSLDEELIRITQANTALEASSTIMREVQSMTATILNMVG